jgi:hypothetical protein
VRIVTSKATRPEDLRARRQGCQEAGRGGCSPQALSATALFVGQRGEVYEPLYNANRFDEGQAT